MITEKDLLNLASAGLNIILEKEREQFRENYFISKAKYLSYNGFESRNLKTTMGDIPLLIPRIRDRGFGIDKIGYSIIDKYVRETNEVKNAVIEFYKNSNPRKFIDKILNKSTISRELKKEVQEEFLQKYEKMKSKYYEGYKMLKLDSTYMKDNYGNKVSIYFVMGIKDYSYRTVNKYLKNDEGCFLKDSSNKCLRKEVQEIMYDKNILYFHVEKGNENTKGWEAVMQYIDNNIDLSNVELIVTDLKSELKSLLHNNFPEVKKQNCIWHRLYSFFHRVKNCTFQQKKKITSSYWKRLTKVNSVNSARDILNELKSFEHKTKKDSRTGKYYSYNSENMLNHFIDDNFNYLTIDKELKLIGRHTQDLEGLFSQIKKYLRLTMTNFKNDELLISRIMMYLESNGWLDL